MKLKILFEMVKDLDFMSKGKIKLFGRCYGNKLYVAVYVNGLFVGQYSIDELYHRLLDFYYFSYALNKANW